MNRASLFSFLIAQAHVMGLCNMSSFLPSSSLYALRALEALNNLASKYPLVVWFGVICLHFKDGEPMQKNLPVVSLRSLQELLGKLQNIMSLQLFFLFLKEKYSGTKESSQVL